MNVNNHDIKLTKTKLFLISILFFGLLHHGFLQAQQNIQLASPNGDIVFSFWLEESRPLYSVAYKEKLLIAPSTLSLSFLENGTFGDHLKEPKPVFREADETYELIVGKCKTVRNHYREVMIPLEETVKPFRQINLTVRAFDDGVAFRYEYLQQKNWSAYTLLDENTTFRLSGNPTLRTLFLPGFTTSHEGAYTTLPLGEVQEDTLMDMPTLFEFPNQIYLAITEAALVDYAGMYLVKHDGVLTSKLSPLPHQDTIRVKAILPHRSPWRVLMISDRIGALIESNILTNLNEPCKIKDVSWIKPGKTSFHWWNGDITPDTTFAPGVNFETNKYYIDFCARNHIDYHAVIGYGGFAWYKSDAAGYGVVGPHTDVTVPVPSLDMQQVCDYAQQKGVGIHVWVHWQAIYPRLEEAFAQFEKWGIKGMMVDFMDRDDQEMVNIQEEILQKAAEHKLYIQFHGAYKPTGWHRTYPNEFTREGALNYEHNKWNQEGLSPEHDLDIVFTRLLAGATDYHLGGFRAVPASEFKTQFTRPLMVGTRCHMLAMYVVLESYLTSLCDYPKAYEGQPGIQPGFDFLQKVPTVWDETIVVDAQVGEYITIVRRKGADWYVGSITNHEARQITIPLDFLSEGTYVADMYTDAPDAEKSPNHLTRQSREVNLQDTLMVSLAPGGGQVMHLRRQ